MGKLNLKPGDRAMLKGTQGIQRHLSVKKVRVSKIYKNGLILIDGSDQKYRSDGSPVGRHGYNSPPWLIEWDDNLFQKAAMVDAQIAASRALYALGESFMKASRDIEAASEIWESLPYSVRKLVEE